MTKEPGAGQGRGAEPPKQSGGAEAGRARGEGSPEPSGGPGGGETVDPWIESREGAFFFINALFIFPWIMLVIPLLTRVLVRGGGGLTRESVILDTFPTMAEYLLPRMGWLLVVPAGLVIMNLRIERARLPRIGLGLFLGLHLLGLAWAVCVWTGLLPPVLPGGPPGGGGVPS